MPLERVGHVVLKMRDIESAKRFYCDILGMKISAERKGLGVFLRFGNYHHDLAIFEVDEDAAPPERNQVGLSHVAVVADSLETVKEMHQRLKTHNVPILRTEDHGFTKSIYFKDPEDNEIEIYCEVPESPWQSVDTFIQATPFDFET